MDRGRLLLLYRSILKAAARYPSIKRKSIIQDIKTEFREGKAITDPREVKRRQEVALDSLERLMGYAQMNSQSTELVLFLRGDATAREDGSSL